MQHLDEGLIHAWLDHALPADEAARIAAHIEGCGECAAAVAEARGMTAGASRIVSALDVARSGVAPASSAHTTRSLWRRLYFTPSRAAIAATLLLAVGSVFTLRHRPPSRGGLPVGKMIDAPLTGPQSVRSVGAPRDADSTHIAQPSVAPRARQVQAIGDFNANASRAELRHEIDSMRAASAPPPITAKAADVVVDSAKSSLPAANLVQGQQKGGVAGSAGAATETRVAADVQSKAAAPAAASAPRAVMGGFAPTRLESALLAAPAGICYAIRPFQGDTTTWLRELPDRFALDDASENRSERAGGSVRIPSAAGRLDSVIQGSRWQQTGPDQVMVVLGAQRTIQLHVATTTTTAEASSGGETHPIAVSRHNCIR